MDEVIEVLDAQQEEALVPVLGMKYWDDSVRGIPNSLLRGGFFGLGGGNREEMRNRKIESARGIEIVYTGTALIQDDLDVALALMHFCKKRIGATEYFTWEEKKMSCAEWLRLLGKGTGGYQNRWLKNVFVLLQTGNFQVKTFDEIDGVQKVKKLVYASILDVVKIDMETKEISIRVNRELAQLFDKDTARICISERLQLKGGLAKWLHAFYSSHENTSIYNYSVETIWGLCGSKNHSIASFRQELKDAFAEIEAATDWQCEINNNKIVIDKCKF